MIPFLPILCFRYLHKEKAQTFRVAVRDAILPHSFQESRGVKDETYSRNLWHDEHEETKEKTKLSSKRERIMSIFIASHD